MTRKTHFRDHLNMPLCCIFDDFLEVFARIVTVSAVIFRIRKRSGAKCRLQMVFRRICVAALATYLCQFRQTIDLDSPAFVFSDSNVEFIYLVRGQ